MRGLAEGASVVTALKGMCQSNKDAALILRDHGATSCTDVTGFGLLGHLVEMAQASKARVELNLDKVPTITGALELVQQGIFSSLQPANIRLKRALENEKQSLGHPSYPLIFDPQTSGGLLASVPAGKAEECVLKLRAKGFLDACVIGVVQADGLDSGSLFCSSASF
jgi:selenide,water dikinase